MYYCISKRLRTFLYSNILRMKLLISLLTICLIVFTSCLKSDNEQFWHKVSRKDGEWHVDRMIVYRLDPNNVLQSVFTVEDPGNFYFEGDKKGDEMFLRFDGSVLLDSTYNLPYQCLKQPLSNLGTSFVTSSDGSGVGEGSNMYFVSYLSKKKLNFYTPYNQNYFYTIGSNFSIYFECSRK